MQGMNNHGQSPRIYPPRDEINGSSPVLTDGAGNGDRGIQNGTMAMDDHTLSLVLDTFQATDFNIASIVSGLTDNLIAQGKEEGGGR